MEQAVRAEQPGSDGAGCAIDRGRTAAGLAHDDVESSHVVQRQLRLDGDVDRALRDEHVRPEVAERARTPHGPQQVAELQPALSADPAVEGRVRQERVRQRAHLRDLHRRRVHQGLARVRTAVGARPPATSEQRRADDADLDAVLDHEPDERRPDRHAADEVRRTVDRVDDPAARTPAGVLALLAVYGVARTAAAQQATDRLLDGGVGVGHLAEVRLVRDPQVLGAEPAHRDRVGVVRQHVGQAEIVGEVLAGCHGAQVTGDATTRAGPRTVTRSVS